MPTASLQTEGAEGLLYDVALCGDLALRAFLHAGAKLGIDAREENNLAGAAGRGLE